MANYDAPKFIAHLNRKWSGRPCSQCGGHEWQVQDSVFELREFHGGNFVVGGPVIPLIPVLCSNCGNTVLVNALVAEVVDRPKEPAP